MSKETKTTVYEFDPCIYPRLLWVVKGGTLDGIKEVLDLGNYDEELEDDSGAMTFCNVRRKSDGNIGALVWFPKASNINNADWIAHESTHVAMWMFEEIGGVFDAHNQEPVAYLVGWSFGCIYKVRKANKDNSGDYTILCAPVEDK